MKRALGTLVTSLMVGSMLGLIAPAPADDRAVRQSLDAIYAQYVQSFKSKDTTAFQRWLERYLTPDAVNKNSDGSTQTRQQMIHGLQQTAAQWQPAREASGKILQLTVKGDKASVLFWNRVVRVIPTSPAGTGSPGRSHQLVMVGTERDTWIKTPAGWKTTMSVNQRGQVTLDGKPLRPPAARAPRM